MFKEQNRILIVDDIESQLIDLAKVFTASGIGCKTVLYDQFYNSQHKNVRIAFFDINITNISIDITQSEFDYKSDSTLRDVFDKLVTALQSCIHKDNGPYALIFWSSNTILINNFLEYINERNPCILKPFLIKGLNKSISNKNIKAEIESLLNLEPEVKLLLDLESNVQEQMSNTLSEIYRLIPNNGNWGDNTEFKINFDSIFSKIAKSAYGTVQAKENPDKAIYEAMMPLVANNTITNVEGAEWKKKLSFPTSNFYDKIYSKLNTVFHIEKNNNLYFKRGAVTELIFVAHGTTNTLDYFNLIKKGCDELFENILKFNYDTCTSDFKNKIVGNSKFIIVEISAACDYNQHKPRNNKFLIGLMTPIIEEKYLAQIGSSIFFKELPIFCVDESEFQFWFNFNYIISDFSLHHLIGNTLFTFKKEIVDMIGNRYANHISRIGITSF